MDHQDFIDECLREHNTYRHLHGVDALKHSTNLDKSAQEWADELITKDHLENSPISGGGNVGENISSRSGSGMKITISGAGAAKQWYDDISHYDFTKSTGAAGNFTQLIWKATEEVGFGIAHANGKCVVVAHYRPAGNVRGNYSTNVLPLVSGEAVPSAAVSGGCCFQGNVQVCPMPRMTPEVWTDELCQFTRESFHARTDSMSSDEHFELGLHDTSDFCKAEKRQRRQFVRETISAINKYRAKHGVPALKHNKDLDEISQKFAEELSTKSTLTNSSNTYKGNKVGESIASRSSNAKCDYKANEVADHWYAEIKNYNFDQEPPNVKGIGNFTQMLWKSSTEVGLGKVHTSKGKDNRVIVVCNFYPAGNVLKRFKDNVPHAI